jgi:AmiR/NasT family two-component response regulator
VAERSDGGAQIGRLIVHAEAQDRKVRELESVVVQLQSALDSRVVIERAVGMLAERFGLSIVGAFDLLRTAARASRRELRTLAEEIVESRPRTPRAVSAALGRP